MESAASSGPLAHVALPIRTARLALRPVDEGDAPAYELLVADAEVRRYLEHRAVPETGARMRARIAREAREAAEGRRLVLAVILVATDRFLGTCSAMRPFLDPDPGDHVVALTVALLPDARCLGYGAEALRGLVEAVRRPATSTFVQLRIDRTNAASLALLDRLEGFEHRSIYRSGDRVEDVFERHIPRERRPR